VVSGVRLCERKMKIYMDVEYMEVYQKLCRLQMEIGDLSHTWPFEEKYEIGLGVRRSSNSNPLQRAEKIDDRHVHDKIERVNPCIPHYFKPAKAMSPTAVAIGRSLGPARNPLWVMFRAAGACEHPVRSSARGFRPHRLRSLLSVGSFVG
jgi:hypothetical protein